MKAGLALFFFDHVRILGTQSPRLVKYYLCSGSAKHRVQDKIICGHLFKIYSVLALINFKVNCLQLSNN